MLRILHVGLGPLGKMIVADLARRGLGRVVAAVDVDPALAGRPLAEIVPECRFEGRVVPSIAEAMAGSPSVDAAVLSTASDLARCMPSLRELMGLGLPVVSTCEELLYPWLRHKAHAEELEALAKRTGSRVLGTGVNPGFLMDTLPVAATAVCRSVRRVKVSRVQDATPRRIPFQQKIGAGLSEAAFEAKKKEGTLRHVGLGESLHFIAHYLGLAVDRWEETLEPVRAERDLTSGVGPIATGGISGVRQVAKGWAKGAAGTELPLVELEFQAAIGQADPADRVVIDGEPPIDLVIRGGVHGDVATSAITLNAIPPLIAAGPGLHTMATVPMVRYVARG